MIVAVAASELIFIDPGMESVTEWLRCHLAKVVWETTREFEPLRARIFVRLFVASDKGFHSHLPYGMRCSSEESTQDSEKVSQIANIL